VALYVAVLPLACDGNGPLEIIVRSGSPDDGGAFHDALPPDTGPDDGDLDADASDAGLSPVIVALSPTPKGEPPTAGDVIDARLDALAAGIRGMVLRRALSEIDEGTEVDALSAEASFWADRGTSLALSLALVDRSVRGLPPNLEGLPWDAPEMFTATHLAIDNTLMALAGKAGFVVIGRDIDVYFASHPADERASLEALLLDTIAYVHEKAPDTRVGVGFSFAGIAADDPSFALFADACDVVVSSYLPGLGETEVGVTSDLASDADVLLTKAGGKPIVLESIGYPSSAVVGGSTAKQALFLDMLFEALVPRRAGFAFVNVDALHDVGATPCADMAKRAGEPPDGPYAAYVCSLGLFTTLGQEKPAWLSFVKGAAAFASP